MKDNRVTVLAGGWDGHEVWGMVPFDEKIMDYLEALSETILQHPLTRDSEEFAAFAFWCRRRHLQQWKRYYEDGRMRMGYGLIFHVAPSNIPALFAYSMAFAMLAGNGSLVRISGRVVEEAEPLCRVMDEVMRRPGFEEIYQNNAVVTYGHETEVTERYCRLCDGRIVWGGDSSIRELRAYALEPGKPQLEFADRCSVAVIDAEHIRKSGKDELLAEAYRFYNDTFAADQNACSSPGVIFWSGETDQLQEVQKQWWQAVYEAAGRYEPDAWKVSRKYEELTRTVMERPEVIKVHRWDNRLYVADLCAPPEHPEWFRGRFGCFYQCVLDAPEQLAECLNRRVQTIACVGADRELIRKMIQRSGCKGGDRVAAPGQALVMDRIWDGKDMIQSLTRIID